MSAGTPETPAYRIDGAAASREAFYAVACDPRRSVIVEACAGAGKTWMLVSRILRALLDGAQPQEILAITFTRKAAGEMRTRLNEWLREFAHGDEAARLRALRERGLEDAEAVRLAPKLAGLHEQVLATGRSVEVRTFHAWFSQLLRVAPMDVLAGLGLQPRMELIEDVDDLRPELMQRFHAALLDDAALRHDYTALAHRHGRHNLAKWLDAAWDKRVEIELADAAGRLDEGMPDAQVVWPAREPLWTLARTLGGSGKAAAVKAAGALEAALGQDDDAAMFEAAWAALFTGKDEPRKLGDWPAFDAACDALRNTRELIAQHEAHLDHARLSRLSRLLLSEYAALKRARSLADMADLERCALALLSDATLSGWVQERLDARVRHVLIDEFQDTSPLQWHALSGWLGAYAGAGGGRAAPSVFIVGDPKQSIYRFRRAEPKVFEAARLFVAEGLGGAVLECDHTRRNAPGVIEALNRVFGALAHERLYAGFRAHTTEVRAPDGAVLHLPGVPRVAKDKAAAASQWRPSLTTPRHEPEEQLREQEANQVADAIAALVAGGMRAGEIFVLARTRAPLRLVGDALQARHLPFVAPEENRLAALPEVRDLVALLDALASHGHDLSLAQALKSPLFGASDDDLLQVALVARERRCAWWSALMSLASPGDALQRARDLLQRWSDAGRVLPPHDLLDRVVVEGDLRARLAAAVPAPRRRAALAAVDALLAQALSLDGGRYATPYNFVRALRSRALKTLVAGEGDAVQLLTVHGAKGLEARVVFVVDADPERRNADTTTLLVDWPLEETSPRQVAFVASESRCPPSLRPLLEIENAARAREELNGLYVAATRAREQLVVSRTEPLRPVPGTSWWARLVPHATPWGVAPAVAPTTTEAAIEVPVLPPAPRRERTPIEPPSGDDGIARLGQAVHRWLEWAAGAAGQQASADALALAATREFGLPAEQAPTVASIGSAVLASPALARFFDASQLRWAGNEVPIAGCDGEILRIDRLVRTDDAWWVLDYKLRHSPGEVEALRAQLARYRAAVQRLQPGEVVHAAFITARGELVQL